MGLALSHAKIDGNIDVHSITSNSPEFLRSALNYELKKGEKLSFINIRHK